MSTSLSEGSLLTICSGGSVDKPVLQVIGHKLITSNTGADRYRVFISDGQYSNSFSMLATQLNQKVAGGEIDQFTIVRVNNYVCNNVNKKKVIIITDLDVLEKGKEVGKKIGDPIQINADGTANSKPNPPPSAASSKRKADEVQESAPKRSPLISNDNRPRSSILDPRPVQSTYSSTQSSTFDASAPTVPIASLTPYQNKWTIKARVTNKSDIRRWNNSKGEGHLFSMDLLDSSGEIRATAFKEMCDKYYNMIEVGKLYYITSCSLKAANRQYCQLNNEYEMTFRDTTEMIPCNEESGGIPTISFDFVKIADLAAFEKDKIVDVIGICKSASDAVTITSQRTQKELVKRDIVLVDQSNTDVNLTIWGTKAETFEPADNPVVCIKGAKVSDFSGVSISALSSSVIQINPDISQSHALKGWYESEGANLTTTSLTQARGAGGSGGNMGVGSNLKTVAEVKRENIGFTEDGRPAFYSTTGYIIMFQKDKALYKACNRSPDGKQCNKKVQDQNNGYYRCEKCNTEIEGFQWRLILSFSMGDPTDNQWVTCFQEEGEEILGVKSAELGNMFENDEASYNKVFQDATFKRFNFRLSVKPENYNDEQRLRHTVRSVAKIDWAEHIQRLVKELQAEGVEIPEK